MFSHRSDRLSITELLLRLAAIFAPLQKGFCQQCLYPRVKAGILSEEMPSHVTCETLVRPRSPGTTRLPSGGARWSFPRLGVGPGGRPSRPFPHLSGSSLGLYVRDLLHIWGAPSRWTRFTNLQGAPSEVVRLFHLSWAPSARTWRNFSHLKRGCYCRSIVFPRRWRGSATYPTGLGPSGLCILFFLVVSTTDVPLPLGILHQQVHWQETGIMLAHIGANLPTKPLHIATSHLSCRKNTTTQAM